MIPFQPSDISICICWLFLPARARVSAAGVKVASSSGVKVAGGRCGNDDFVVKNPEAMEGAMKSGRVLLSLYGNILAALQECAEQPSAAVDESQLWSTAKDVFVLMQDALAPLQASPLHVIENLHQYAACLAKLTLSKPALTTEADGSSGAGTRRADGVAYVASHMTAEILGSGAGDSRGECFRKQWSGQATGHVEAAGPLAALYEAMLVDFHIVTLRMLKSAMYWALLFEPGTHIDSSHALSQYHLAPFARALMELWCQPLPGVVKAELVLVLDSLVLYSCRHTLGCHQIQGAASTRCNFAALTLDFFVAGCLLPPITEAAAPFREGREYGHVGEVSGRAPSALVYELSLMDRKRGRYEHTLAILTLLKTLSSASTDALAVKEVLRLLDMCLPLLPSTSPRSLGDVFAVAAQRWQVTQALFDWYALAMHHLTRLHSSCEQPQPIRVPS